MLIASIHTMGISVTSLGLGVDYDTALMTQIARDTGGEFHYLEKPEEVAAVFDHELMKMTMIVGGNLQLVLEPGPGVTIEPMPGLTPAGDGTVYATIGDLPAGEVRDLMIPVHVAARADGSTVELVDATLSFDDVISGSGRQQRTGYVGAKSSSDDAKVKAAVKIGLEAARIRASAAAAILDAIGLARAGQLAAAQQRLAEAITGVQTAAGRLHDPDLDQLAQELVTLGKQLSTVVVQPAIAVDMHGTMPMPVPQPAVAPADVEPGLRRAEDNANALLRGQHR